MKTMWNAVGAAALAAALIGWGAAARSEDKPAAPAGTAQPAGAPEALSEAAVKEAKDIFSSRCAVCHGAEGKGDGAASKGLTPPPRDFSLSAWQKSVTDAHIEKIITLGGVAVGKSPAMPPNPDLTAKQEVVKALRAHIRTLEKK